MASATVESMAELMADGLSVAEIDDLLTLAKYIRMAKVAATGEAPKSAPRQTDPDPEPEPEPDDTPAPAPAKKAPAKKAAAKSKPEPTPDPSEGDDDF